MVKLQLPHATKPMIPKLNLLEVSTPKLPIRMGYRIIDHHMERFEKSNFLAVLAVSEKRTKGRGRDTLFQDLKKSRG
uniref:Uncharacterized protein n=1 Tax=Nelumbo nucifera TaxID=4432 RepID=A0A822ZQ87_NELNU|nr:TPA_asm: hypothetical protein HUJ06_002198 [Nelumbo nucifera]